MTKQIGADEFNQHASTKASGVKTSALIIN